MYEYMCGCGVGVQQVHTETLKYNWTNLVYLKFSVIYQKEEEENRKKEEEEAKKQQAELEEYERKMKGRKRKPRKQHEAVVEESFFSKYRTVIILSASVMVLAVFLFYILGIK